MAQPRAVVVTARTVQRIGVPAALLTGIALVLYTTEAHYPVAEWLFWHYARAWALSLVFAASALSAGHLIVRALAGRSLPLSEHLVVSFALGVAAFALGVFFAGLLGLLGSAFFVAWPLVLGALGARSLLELADRAWHHLSAAHRRAGPLPAWTIPVWLAGGLGFVFVYAPLLVPGNVAYDARWYHLPIAEQYAAAGRIFRFAEGWYLATYPQLATYLYTWACLVPGGRTYDFVMLSGHIELICFLFTLAGIAPLVRRLVPGLSGRGAWAVLFLFPGIFLYDSNLVLGADHLLALFAVPIWLLLLRAFRTQAPRDCALFALAAGAAFLVKYTSALLVAPAALAFGARALWLAGRALKKHTLLTALRGPAIALGTFVLVTAPHWLKNLIWYGDPFYPMLHGVLGTLRPWSATARLHYDGFVLAVLGRPVPGWEGWRDSLRSMVTFAFEPHDWWYMHGQVPVFGFLFTLGVLVLPFLGKRWRLWGVVVAVHLAVLLWFRTHHFDRYLQALVPWMAAFTAAVLALAWRTGAPARACVLALCALQVVWGGDVPHMPHAITGEAIMRSVAQHLAQGYYKQYEPRLLVSDIEPVGASLPKHAKVLLHDMHMQLGLRRQAVNDWSVYQAGLDYAKLGSPRAIHDALRVLGVTHLLWIPGTSKLDNDSVAGVIAFWRYAELYGRKRKAFSGYVLVSLPHEAPQEAAPIHVAYLGCHLTPHASGLYRLEDLAQLYKQPPKAPLEPELDGQPQALVDRAEAVVIETCRTGLKGLSTRFRKVHTRPQQTFWVRTSDGALPPQPAPASPKY